MINGLVIAGGKSSRMRQNKAYLRYHSLHQYDHVYKLLQPFCKNTFVSVSQKDAQIDLPQIVDAHQDIGPISALDAAYNHCQTIWMVVAIDYPLLQPSHLLHLVDTHLQSNASCVYYNTNQNIYEPFIGIYTVDFLATIAQQIQLQNFSMQQILKQQQVQKVYAPNNTNITSIDTPMQYRLIKHHLS